MPRDRRLGLVVLLEVEDPDQLVVRAGGQRLGVVAEVDRLDDVLVGQRELLFAGSRVPDLEKHQTCVRRNASCF